MNIEQEKMIVESLSSLYPLQEFEEKAIHTVLDALPSAQPYTIHSDGRLWVTVDDIDKVRAVVVDEHKSKFCKQFYEDAQPEPLTDKEQRIFLAAMGREEKVCKQVDEECRDCREPYEDSLVSVCREITRKVKGALWTI